VFESLQPVPADAILGLIAEHRDDPRPNKIDLGVAWVSAFIAMQRVRRPCSMR